MNIKTIFDHVPLDVITMWVLGLLTFALVRTVMGKEPTSQLIASLNSLSPQGWAFLILIVGVIAAIAFNRAGIAVDIAAGIIGAGINMFTSQRGTPLPGTSTSHLEVDTTPPLVPTPKALKPTPATEPEPEGHT